MLWRCGDFGDIDSGVSHTDPLVGEVLEAVSTISPPLVLVTGHDALADALRARIGHFDESSRPQAIVETTGTNREVAAALSRVDDGGIVVLAGSSSEAIDLDLYTDLHRRGLVLIGVAGAGRSAD